MSNQDLAKLQKPIISVGVALVLAGLVIGLADNYRTASEQALQKQQSLLNTARQKFQSSGLEKQTITEYLPIYNDLISKGFVGEERRIEWVENLRQTHAQHKLFSIDYNIDTQQTYKPSFIPNLGNFKLQRSVMTLNLPLLHEGDLLDIIDGLSQQTTPFMVRECEISRPVGAQIETKNMVANMQATCNIDWLTLRDPQLTQATATGAL
jgi:hypothetical protein